MRKEGIVWKTFKVLVILLGMVLMSVIRKSMMRLLPKRQFTGKAIYR